MFAVVAVLFGALTFLAASAFVVSRDQPKWLAATIGALAFPVLPVVWHALGERRRKKRLADAKTPPKGSLTSSDRYTMRAIAVVLVVIGPMVAVGRFGFVRAMWTHKAWFVPRYEVALSDDLLAHVPSDAEAVLTVRDPSEKQKGAGLYAWGDRQLLVLAKGPDMAKEGDPAKQVEKINSERSKFPFVKIDPIALVPTPKDMFAAASERWQTQLEAGPGASADLRRELARAPTNAMAILAVTPKTTTFELPFKSGAAWVVSNDNKVVIDGRLEASDAASAERLVDTMRVLWKLKAAEVPAKCRDEVEKVAGQVKTERTAEVVTFHLELEGEQLIGIMLCNAFAK